MLEVQKLYKGEFTNWHDIIPKDENALLAKPIVSRPPKVLLFLQLEIDWFLQLLFQSRRTAGSKFLACSGSEFPARRGFLDSLEFPAWRFEVSSHERLVPRPSASSGRSRPKQPDPGRLPGSGLPRPEAWSGLWSSPRLSGVLGFLWVGALGFQWSRWSRGGRHAEFPAV